MTAHPFTEPDRNDEDLADGATWLLDLVSAVDHLRRGYRPGLTVWDALAEALDWDLDATQDTTSTTDPLRDVLSRITQPTSTSTAVRVQSALRRWVTTMADRYNNGHHWPHPTARRHFPPPTLDI